jgi:hypothetical protein
MAAAKVAGVVRGPAVALADAALVPVAALAGVAQGPAVALADADRVPAGRHETARHHR